MHEYIIENILHREAELLGKKFGGIKNNEGMKLQTLLDGDKSTAFDHIWISS